MSAVRVKICGITRAEDAAAAVAAGADALGLVFASGSPRAVEIGQAAALCRFIPAFVSRVGLFLDQDAGYVEEVLRHVPLSLLQFHGLESAEYCRQLQRPYIKAVSARSGWDPPVVEAAYPDAAAILLDSHAPGGQGGTGRSMDWSAIRRGGLPLILAGGLGPGNVAAAVRMVRPWAVDVSTGVEIAPGIKDHDAMRSFIREARSA